MFNICGYGQMKVYIGPYVYRWVSYVHDKYMDKKYGRYDWQDSSTNFEHALEKLEDGLQWFYNATINRIIDNMNANRKISVRIDNYDTWSMDDTLAHIIVPMLKQLKDTKHGVPHTDMEDVSENCRVEDKENKIEWMMFRWHYVIDEMIWAFEQKTLDWEDQYTTKEDNKVSDYDAMKGVDPEYTYTFDHEGMKTHHERMMNGFRLFGKYYESLWD
jgi:hypothetical protein